MLNPAIDIEVHERYKTASTVRDVIQRMNPTPSKPITNYVESHGITFHRMREIDVRIELGASDTKAPFLIGHHIHNGIRLARAHLNDWSWNVQFLAGRKTAYHLATAWISSTLEPRLLPAMYAAKLEIDPSGVYEKEYVLLRTEFLNRCKTIHEDYQHLGSRRSKTKRQEEKSLYRAALERFVADLEDWQTRALSDLAPSQFHNLV